MPLGIESSMTIAGQRKHVCKHCLKSFKRSEHCARHVRAHTQEKPFSCQYCHKHYSRKDLVVRHERTLHAEEHARNQSSTDTNLHRHSNDANALSSPDYNSQDSPIEAADETLDAIPDDTIVVDRRQRPTSSAEIHSLPSPISNSNQADPTLPVEQLLNEIDNCTDSAVQPISSNAQRTPQDPVIVPDSFITSTSMPANDSAQSQDMPMNEIDYQSQGIVSMEGILMDTDLMNLDFFDPYLGSTYDNFALPTLPDGSDFLSPFETRLDNDQDANSDANPPVDPVEDRPQTQRQMPAGAGSRSSGTTSEGLYGGASSSSSGTKNISYNGDAHAYLWTDLSSRLAPNDLGSFKLPSAALMRKWLRVYIDSFHVHFPFIHLPTLDLRTTPSPLTLAICAIGALYRLNRSAAAALHVKAIQCLDSLEVNLPRYILEHKLLQDWTRPTAKDESIMRRPLWHSQARLLSSIFAIFSGDPLVVRKAFQDLGLLSTDYRLRLMYLRPGLSDRRMLSWNQWVERESAKRFLHMAFIFSNLANITYGVPPGFSLSNDGIVEMPDDEIMWQAQTEQVWCQLSNSRPKIAPISLRDVAGAIVSGDSVEELIDLLGAWSVFGTSVAIHAVCTQIWHFGQGAISATRPSGRSTPENTGHYLIHAKKTQAALNRCRDLLMEVHNEHDHLDYDAESPLLFNSFAILRVSFSRAFTSAGLMNRELLLYESRDEIISAIHDYVSLTQERSEFITRAISRSFEGFVIPFQSSALFVRKTAALTWSIEHALAGWDAALFVTKWIFAIEMLQSKGISITESEKETMRKVSSLIEEEEYDGTDVLLSSSLARLWASFYDDTWVWGVTPRMGWILRELGNAYEAVFDKRGPLPVV